MLPYKDHSGKRLLFAEAIKAIAIDRYGLDWKLPFPGLTVRRLPEHKEDASPEEQIYAKHLIQENDPDIKINEIKDEFNDSIPSHLKNQFNLDIDAFQWKFATELANSSFEKRSLALQQLFDVMSIFATSASNGITKCYAREIGMFTDHAIEPNAWQVDVYTLNIRYKSGIIETMNDKKETVRSMIIVERSTLPVIESVAALTKKKKLLYVESKLIEAIN